MSSMLRVIQQRCAFHKPLISKHLYSYALPQSELLGNGAITPVQGDRVQDMPIIQLYNYLREGIGIMKKFQVKKFIVTIGLVAGSLVVAGAALALDTNTMTVS